MPKKGFSKNAIAPFRKKVYLQTHALNISSEKPHKML